MIEFRTSPRFCDTDALGHLNNGAFFNLFEEARCGIFKIFNPSLNISKWSLIVARVEVDYKNQTHYPFEITFHNEN